MFFICLILSASTCTCCFGQDKFKESENLQISWNVANDRISFDLISYFDGYFGIGKCFYRKEFLPKFEYFFGRSFILNPDNFDNNLNA